MNIQHILLTIVIAILLVTSFSSGLSLDGNETNVTIDSNITNPITTYITSNTPTTAQITTAHSSSEQPTTTAAISTASPTNSTATTTTTTTKSTEKPITPTTKSPGRKFDSLSFIGGIILAAGLGGIIFLVVSYLRRSNRLPYSNLQ